MNNPYRISTPPDEPEPLPFQERQTALPRESRPMSWETKLMWGTIAWLTLIGIILVSVSAK